jgi:tetratricopeptide (TPR) repeat protein
MLRASLILISALCLPLFSACSSAPKEMTDAEKLDYYGESCMRYYDMHAFDRAIHQANKGLQVDPQNEFLRLVKARCLLFLNKTETLETAHNILEDLLKTEDFRVFLVAGEVAERRGLIRQDSAAGIESGDTYTDAPDPKARGTELRAEARNMWTAAMEHYSKAEKIYPGGTEALNGIMRVASLLGDDDHCLQAGRALLQSLSESNLIQLRKIEELRNTESSSWQVQRAVFANQKVMIATYIHLSELHYKHGRKQAAMMELNGALKLDDTLPELHARRGQLLLETGDAPRAQQALKQFFRLTQLDFDHPDVVRARQAMRKCEQLLGGLNTAPEGPGGG